MADAVFYIQTGMVKLTVVSPQDTKAVVAILERGAFGMTEQLRGIVTGSIEDSGGTPSSRSTERCRAAFEADVTSSLSQSDLDNGVQIIQCALGAGPAPDVDQRGGSLLRRVHDHAS